MEREGRKQEQKRCREAERGSKRRAVSQGLIRGNSVRTTKHLIMEYEAGPVPGEYPVYILEYTREARCTRCCSQACSIACALFIGKVNRL